MFNLKSDKDALRKEIKTKYDSLNNLQKSVVRRNASEIIRHPFMTSEMKEVIGGLILTTDITKYEG